MIGCKIEKIPNTNMDTGHLYINWLYRRDNFLVDEYKVYIASGFTHLLELLFIP